MACAIEEAGKAAQTGDVPVGAVVVKDGAIVGRGRNRIEAEGDPTAHAEIVAIRDAARATGAKWLIGCTLYVTAEPCTMCAGAAVLARLDAIVAGCPSDKSGACGTVADILSSESLNHRVSYEAGVLEEECAALLTGFFRGLRERKAGNCGG
ncbi:MAG: nucleoside deaminase [Clostridiales Family XIII bacterium]|nr:nucleoside deaminase [Clostridiales Family XIII bacterium]